MNLQRTRQFQFLLAYVICGGLMTVTIVPQEISPAPEVQNDGLIKD